MVLHPSTLPVVKGRHRLRVDISGSAINAVITKTTGRVYLKSFTPLSLAVRFKYSLSLVRGVTRDLQLNILADMQNEASVW